ncbi:hypothetical protein FGG08_002026 [Glutinoglossum americanum]|uniref:Transcription initiation factor IIF subunit alpha n=1 Tax=Glutinoglossum americanum TaxID=1670608 RepID=A0A9P8I757_9PEZI|nr:hypothetical protein FGG08_002026 [Glutinoglossum americanum]
MSASPPVPPSSRTPNGGPPPFIRRPKADPLVRPKKRQQRRLKPPGAAAPKVNGVAVVAGNKSNPKASLNDGLTATPQAAQPVTAPVSSIWSQPPGENVKEFPLVTTKRALLEGVRHHVARFSSNKLIDPFNERDFTRPVRLHRRDPRAPPAGAGGAVKDEDTDMANTDSKEAMLDDKERERQEMLRLEKEAQRQADLAQIAPSVNTGPSNTQKKQPFKKKTQQVFRNDISAEAQAQSKLRYEEALPWHLEDFDNKNTWVGNYESALSGTYVMLVLTNTGFEMVSLEKWYKLTPKNQFKALTIEEAEARMGQKVKEPRWFMDSQREQMRKKEEEQNRKAGNKLFLGKWERAPTGRAGAAIKSEFAEADDLDYEEDRFADDEENQLFEGDADETKEAEERIKRDQLQANIFDLKDEKEYDKEDELEKKESELSKKLGKKIRKTLVKQEKNYVYDTDSDNNPYSSSSDSDSSEEERRKEEEAKKEEEKKATLEKEKSKAKDGEKLPSGASSKGTNTPSGRNKTSDLLKLKSSSTLKRPGSPNLSEASGTESSKKKKKHKKHGSSSQDTGTSPPSPVPMPSAPTQLGQPRKSSVVSLAIDPAKLQEVTSAPPRPSRANAGSNSDGETTDGGVSRKIKFRLGSATSPSPTGSRAGSPNPSDGASKKGSIARQPGSGSRQGSPGVSTPAASLPPITEAEVRAAIPPGGTTVAYLSATFKNRITNKATFIAMVKKVAVMGPDKLLVPRMQTPST